MAGFPSVKKGNKLGESPSKQPRQGVQFKKDQVVPLITKLNGNLARIADTIGTTRGSLRRFIDKDEELKDLLEQSRERVLDELEDVVWQDAIENKDPAMRCFLLKTRGKHRGYDQSEAQNTAKDIATAAFDFIINKSKNPAEPTHN